MKNTHVYIVATVTDDGDSDLYADVVGVYTSEPAARTVATKVENHQPVEGVNYVFLRHCDKVVVLARTLNKEMTNAL